MSGKGSARRPASIPNDEMERRWANTFRSRDEHPSAEKVRAAEILNADGWNLDPHDPTWGVSSRTYANWHATSEVPDAE